MITVIFYLFIFIKVQIIQKQMIKYKSVQKQCISIGHFLVAIATISNQVFGFFSPQLNCVLSVFYV